MENEQRKFELYKLFIEIEYNSRVDVTLADWDYIFYDAVKLSEKALKAYEKYHADKQKSIYDRIKNG